MTEITEAPGVVAPCHSFDPAAIVAALLGESGPADRWQVACGALWLGVRPVDVELPSQGWKLHVSATPLSAAAVLERAGRILVRRGVGFKVAATPRRVRELVSRGYDRASAGKFLTVYPPATEDLESLASELHYATAGLAGPRILSDRPYRPDSLVQYRYGGFHPALELADNGTYRPMIVDVDGERVPDVRAPRYTAPRGIPDPFEVETASDLHPTRSTPAPKAVVLADRFVVRSALRFSTKGGVFQATDRLTGEQVIVKQGRAHIDATIRGTDVRDLLRNEAEMLDLLAPLGLTPRKIAFVSEAEHVFLIEERLDGASLRLWNLRARAGGKRPDWQTITDLAVKLIDLVSQVHEAGVVLRDLTPDNVFVAPDGRISLIDLELATLAGKTAPGGGTAGFCAPEQIGDGESSTRAPHFSADLYSLGAVLHLLVTGTEPLLAPEEPAERHAAERLVGRLAAMATDDTCTRRMTPVILGLMSHEPENRWPLDLVRRRLTDLRDVPDSAVPELSSSHGPAADKRADAERLVSDCLTHLLRSMSGDDSAWLWPADGFPATTDPCNLYYGSAGLLGVLTRAIGTGHQDDDVLRAAVRRAAEWTLKRADAEPRLLPGLYFGRSGTAWALLDAGLLLGDDTGLVAAARDMALRIPLDGPNPDVVHGVAGAGLTHIHFLARTGDARFKDRAAQCAEGLLRVQGGGPYDYPHWFVNTNDDRQQDPVVVHYGFAHGMAGIGTFLLEAAAVLSDQRLLETARRIGEVLAAAASENDGALRWTAGPSATVPLVNWCSGSSGIGTFLLRLWQSTGDAAYLRAASGAAEAVHADRWLLPPSACHGVAGNAEFQLDLAQATGDESRMRQVWAAVDPILANTALRGGLLLPADDTRREVTSHHHTGLGGVAGFLLRLLHAGPRAWLPDGAAGDVSRPHPSTQRCAP